MFCSFSSIVKKFDLTVKLANSLLTQMLDNVRLLIKCLILARCMLYKL